jgi:Carboxypeptidase regulatory-like domain
MNRRVFTLFTLLSAVLLLSALSFGQAISGDLTGVVKDASGAYVPNAAVEATNLATGFKQTTNTNPQGEYHFSNLPVGHYSVDASSAGLKGGYRDVEVVLNKIATANINAAVVSAGTTVEVNEQAVAIDTTTPTISTTFDAKQSADSPITSTGTGVLNLSLLDAGVASSGGVGVGVGPSVGGQRPRNNNFTVEGVDNNSITVTGPLMIVPNDAVDSFTVLQNQYSAEFGHSSGGQFNQTIKSGTNQFHGRAYEYFQNRNLNAIDSQTALSQVSNGQTPSNPRFDNNRYGGQLGGPILKNKLFFFTDWEYNTIGQTATPSTACAPTSAGYAQLAALFPNNTNLQQFQKYVPAATSSPTVCGLSGGANTVTVAPGLATTNPNFSNLAVSIPVGDVGFIGPSYQNFLNTANSVDWNISEKDQVRGRLAYTKNPAYDTTAQVPAFWTINPTYFWLVTLSEYHNFSNNVNNEFRFGFNRFNTTTSEGNATFPGLGAFPNLQVFELNGIQLGPDQNAPQETIQNLYQFVDNVSWVKGKHNIRFGGEFRWIISPQTFTQRLRGDYEWSFLSDYLNDFAPDPNAGDFAERSAGNVVYYGNKKAVYGYINDEWRITPTVTINGGLRYEYTGEPEGTSLQSLNAISSVPGLINFTAPKPQYSNIFPRVGIAWAPDANTSIDAGFSMANDVIYDNANILSLPPQVQQTCDTTAPGSPQICPYAFNGFLAAGGLPNTPIPITDAATARAATSAYIPNQTLPYSETYTLGVQHIFDNKYTLEVRYVGTRGIHLPVQTRLNVSSPVTATQNLPTYLSAPSQATLDSLPYTLDGLQAIGNQVPAYANAGFGANITSYQPWGSSNYNGLQVSFKRNFTNGLQFQSAFTWSHTFDNSTADVFSTVLTPRRPQDFQCFACDYGTSALDRRLRATLAVTYDMPFFKNSNWFMKNLVGNWQASPIYTYQSPEYATVQSTSDANLNGDSATDRGIINPAGISGTSSSVTPLLNSSGATVAYLATNPNAYYIQAGPGAFATAQRNTLATPPINNWDFSLLKRVNITERQSVEFSFQATNIFNHAQYVPGNISDVAPVTFTSGVVRGALLTGSPTFAQWNQVFSNHPRNVVLVMKYNF